MGVLFIDKLNGRKFFICRSCKVYLANKDHMINTSTQFLSASGGPALLFQEVTNVEYGDSQPRNLLTGNHYVRDVFCKRCAVKLGWFYEFAARKSQRYKEGKTILEEAMIFEDFNDFMD